MCSPCLEDKTIVFKEKRNKDFLNANRKLGHLVHEGISASSVIDLDLLQESLASKGIPSYIDYEENGNIYQEVDKEIFTFSYTENYHIPNSLCKGESGRLDFNITAYAQDKILGIGFQDLFYKKSDGQIHFMTIKEYYETAGGTSTSKVTGTLGWYDDSDIWHPLPFVKVVIADVSRLTFTPPIYTDENGQFEYTYSTTSVRNINLIIYAGANDAYVYTLTAPSISGTTLHFSWVAPKDSNMWKDF